MDQTGGMGTGFWPARIAELLNDCGQHHSRNVDRLRFGRPPFSITLVNAGLLPVPTPANREGIGLRRCPWGQTPKSPPIGRFYKFSLRAHFVLWSILCLSSSIQESGVLCRGPDVQIGRAHCRERVE